MGERGINPARPFAIRPPLTVHPGSDRIFTQGESFNITLNLFGDAVEAVSYVVQAMMRVGEIGVGYHRGRFRVVNVEAIHPFTGQTQALMPRPGKLKKPELILTAQDVHTYIHNARTQPMRLRFLTPTQLTAEGKPLDKPTFSVLIARLLERCQSLEQTYTPQPPPASQWRERHLRLTNAAAHIKATSSTTWVRIESGSRRISERNAMGGFVGDMILDGDLMPFLVWIAWGSLLHVGKNAVKGGGWYEIL